MKTTSFQAIVLLIFVLANADTILSQTRESENSVPRDAKFKAIEYPNKFILVGYVLNNKFVEDQYLAIHDQEYKENISYFTLVKKAKSKLGVELLSGVLFEKNENYYLGSTIKKNNSSNQSTAKVIFKLSNFYDANGLIPTYNERKDLKIEIADIIQYKGSDWSENPVYLYKNSDSSGYVLKIKLDDRVLEISLPLDYMKKYKFTDVTSVLGLGMYSQSIDTRILRAETSQSIDNLISSIINDSICSSKEVKLAYTNGNTFIGSVAQKDNKYVAKSGVYKYKTGEIYVGDLVPFKGDSFEDDSNPICLMYYNFYMPNQGEFTFTDGSTVSGNWLRNYKLTDNQWVYVYENYRSPTESRDIIADLDRKNKGEAVIKKEEEERTKKEIIRKEQAIKENLIKKYGNYWGELIYNREFTLGMTKPMVLEFSSEKYYNISKVISNGNYIEKWVFDKQKIEREVIKEGSKEGAEALLIMSFLENFVSGGISTQFPTLVFTNGKLTGIYQN